MQGFSARKSFMVSPILRMRNYDMGPPWLKPMLEASYFNPCATHGDSTKSECNMYCLDCMGNSLCSHCLIHHKDHRVLQIRRSSYHNVVRLNDIQKCIDISCVQTYIINSAKVVFLNERLQQRLGKGVTNTCEICGRGLQDSFRFCSIGCKLGGLKRDDQGLTFTLSCNRNALHGGGFESDESSTATKIRKIRVFNHLLYAPTISSDGGCNTGGCGGVKSWHCTYREEEAANYISPATPPIFNHRNSRRRKGIPHRAPF